MKSKIRNYQIQTRLGSGSYGVIFKAINKNDKQQCVLKQIRMNKMSEKAKKSTLNEATIMGKLIHPFIVQYKESFVEDDTLHIVMEYCDNGDLSMYLKMQNKKPLKEEKIWKFFIQICLGLDYIHKNKILHRDIKTLNIFLNKNEDIKIGDLGVAKMLMANDFAQTIVGTPFYLSPELCEQKPYNQKSDIWALGCLLYELCTFRHPFEAANQASLILKIIRGKYSPIPEFYSKQLKDVIDMCLERDYKRRPTANMLMQRSKIRQYIKEFKIEEKIKDQYERMRANKENKQPQQTQTVEAKKEPNIVKPTEKKVIQTSQPQKNVAQLKKEIVSAKVTPSVENVVRKVSVEKKQPLSNEKKPTISGMPEQNIILPDKNNIIQKLKSNNHHHLPPKKEIKSPIPIPVLKQQQSQKKIKENKEEFLKNLEKVIDSNVSYKRSPIKEKLKGNEEISTSSIFQQKSRLQKIDMKIKQQLKKQKEIQKLKVQNQRKKVQTPTLANQRPDQKHLLGVDRKSVPALISRQIGKQPSRYQSNHAKQADSFLIPPLPPKNKQQIIKVKMQQLPIQAKVFQSQKGSQQKSKCIIKSKGFSQELKQENNLDSKINDRKINDFKRRSADNVAKPVLFGLDEEEREKKAVIKNEGFQRKSTHEGMLKSSQYLSERNIKVISESSSNDLRVEPKKQPQHYLFKKKPQSQVPTNSNSRVRNKGVSNYNQLSRNAKNVSKYSEVTKEDEDVVMNLPDSLRHKNDESSDEEMYQNEKEIKMNKNFELKDINNSTVLQKYEEIINSKSSISNSVKSSPKLQKQKISQLFPQVQIVRPNQKDKDFPPKINKNLNEYDNNENNQKSCKKYFIPQQKVNESEINRKIMEPSICLQKQKQKEELEFIPENESLAFKTQRYEDEDDEILDESEEMIDCEEKQISVDSQYHSHRIQEEIYEVNNFNLDEEMRQNPNDNQNYHQESYRSNEYQQNKNNEQTQSQWSFDEEPQLPLLEDKQSPFFEEANPYLVPQQQEETIQQKRNYLQIRLQQNMKRQDEINKLMQIKIEQCKSVVPKYFDQILEFFRKKINKQDEYTENDERQVEDFLRKKGLTDQRKFQNIYKIMHFEMELQNTRKIIQRICKKLSDLDNNKDED